MQWLQAHLPELAMSAAMAWGAGLRLYLVVFVVGMLGKFGYVPLPEALKILSNPLVLGAAGFMSFIEFFADKIPWLDSAWDALHTFLRIPAGAALAAGMLGDTGEGVAMAAAIIGGTLTAGTHFGKAGARAAVNTSPEPFSNIGVSLVEDTAVAGGLALAFANPIVFLVVLLVFVVALVLLIRWVLKGLQSLINRLSRRTATI
jgi:Na+-transporting NADH:ubiquinone oxidoreductase subunit NqrE